MSSFCAFDFYCSPFGSVRKSCAQRVLHRLNEWIEGRAVGAISDSDRQANVLPTFNVFIADYVDLKEDKFIKTVINLNYAKVAASAASGDGGMVNRQKQELETVEEVTDLE